VVDERDLEIIAALQEDARATYADIGRRAGCRPPRSTNGPQARTDGSDPSLSGIVDPEALGCSSRR
jgi:hypothetical protein